MLDWGREICGELETAERRVVISGDTRPCESLVRHARDVDLLIHECTDMTHAAWAPGCGWPTREAKIRDLQAYHTGPDEVGEVAARARARHLVRIDDETTLLHQIALVVIPPTCTHQAAHHQPPFFPKSIGHLCPGCLIKTE